MTVTAQWTLITYPISYDLNGGTLATANPTSYTVEDAITLNNPARNGYQFDGWTGTDLIAKTQNVTIASGSTGNRSYTANFTPIKYAITYNLNGGTNNPDNPAEYTIESDTITLKAPTKNGYEFTGWTPDGVISKGSIGDKTFTANFVIIPVSDDVKSDDIKSGDVTSGDVGSKDVEPELTSEDKKVQEILDKTSGDLSAEEVKTVVENLADPASKIELTQEQSDAVIDSIISNGTDSESSSAIQTLLDDTAKAQTLVENLGIVDKSSGTISADKMQQLTENIATTSETGEKVLTAEDITGNTAAAKMITAALTSSVAKSSTNELKLDSVPLTSLEGISELLNEVATGSKTDTNKMTLAE